MRLGGVRRMSKVSLIANLLAVAILGVGCGSEEPAADQKACTPGVSQACVGPGRLRELVRRGRVLHMG